MGANREGAGHRGDRVRGVRRGGPSDPRRARGVGARPPPQCFAGGHQPACRGRARRRRPARRRLGPGGVYAAVRRGSAPRRAGAGARLPDRSRRVLAHQRRRHPGDPPGARGAGGVAAAAGRRVDVRGVRRARRCPHRRGGVAGTDEPVRVEQARRGSGRRRPGGHRRDRRGQPPRLQRRRWASGTRGPGRDAGLVPKAVAVVQGRAPELVVNGDGGAVRDYVHVADMADAFVRALDACRAGHWTTLQP